MPTILDLFYIKNGISSENVNLSEYRNNTFTVPYIRPSSRFDNLVAGYVNIDEIDSKYIFPKDSILVSTDGQGSHSYAYVSPVEFIPNSNVCVLIPKTQLTLNEKIFYAMIVTNNRFRFSYGRKPKGERFSKMQIPPKEKIPKWVYTNKVNLDNYSKPITENKISFNTIKWQWFRYEELFIIKKGKRLIESDFIEGNTPFIGAIDSNNGLSSYIGQAPIFEGNTITINYDGNGVAESYYQQNPFWALDSVNVLYPKFKLNKYIAIFLVTLFRKEKFRFSYGRKWGMDRMKKSLIKLPIEKNGNPDWDYMENYIKSLPYSSSL